MSNNMFYYPYHERAHGAVATPAGQKRHRKKTGIPTGLCLAIFPALAFALDPYVDTGLNHGAQGNVPNVGDYGNVAVPSGNNVYVASRVPQSVFGGYTRNGTAENNHVTIVGTQVGSTYGSHVAIDGDASHNHVSISAGSYVEGWVQGGYTAKGQASDNHILVTDSRIWSALFGGQSENGQVQGNSVTMENGIVEREVMGGYAYQGDAIGNRVEIRGGQVAMEVIGGASGRGSAMDNHVKIAGAPVLGGDIYGGMAGNASASATNNTVTLATDPNARLENSTIYGGFTYLPGTGDIVSGNTLHVESGQASVKNIAYFERIHLHLTHLPPAGQPILEMLDTGGTHLQGVRIEGDGTIDAAQPLASGTTITLLRNSNGIETDTEIDGNVQLRQGISLNHTFRLTSDGQNIDAVWRDTQVDPATGIFQNSRLASVDFLNAGSDFVLDTGMHNALHASESGKLGLYGAVNASTLRQNPDKGAQIHTVGTHWLLGLASRFSPDQAHDLIGSVYAEAGWGNIDSRNDFARGHGDTRYYGLGLIGRYQQNTGAIPGVYGEIHARIGRVRTDFRSPLSDSAERPARYDTESTYYGAGLQTGYIWAIGDTGRLDLSARYQWLHIHGNDTHIAGDPYRFDAIDSHRTRIGARLSATDNKTFTPYVGLAWEHEFSATARGSVYGYALEDNRLKGDTGIGEMGITFSPSAQSPWHVDAHISGYTGQRNGVAGRLVAHYRF